MPRVFDKDPSAVLDYQIDWTDWLALTPPGTADTISTSTWTVPTGITKASDSKTTVKTTVWVSGGTAGQQYELVNRIVTVAGRTAERTIVIWCREE